MKVTLEQVRAFRPCYDPEIYEISSATLTEILKMSGVPSKDRIWIIAFLVELVKGE